MGYRLGVDIGPQVTVWVLSRVDGSGRRLERANRVPSVAAPGPSGLVAGGDVVPGSAGTVSGFAARMGDPNPVMVGGVPYGAESLVGAQLASCIRAASALVGRVPEFVVLTHPDGADEYRVGLWREAARVAGVPVTSTVVVSRSFAWSTLQAFGWSVVPGDEVAAGAALSRLESDPDPMPAAAVGIAEVGVAAGAAGAVAVGGVLAAGTDAVASAAGVVAGPAGIPLSPAGPAGIPLSPAGPTGIPLSPAGPTGIPLSPAPVTPSGSVGVGSKFSAGLIKAVIGAVVVIVVGATVAVVATRGEDPAPATLGDVDSTQAAPATADSLGGSVVPSDTLGGPVAGVDVSPLLGSWMQECLPYLAGDGASGQIDSISSSGASDVDVVMEGNDYTSTDCAQPGEITITVTVHLTVVAERQMGDIHAYASTERAPAECASNTPEACAFAMSTMHQEVVALGLDAAGLLRFPEAGASLDAEGFPSAWAAPRVGAERL